MSTGAAITRTDLAHTVCGELPGLLDAMRHGGLDLPKAQEIAVGTCEVDPGPRRALAARAIGYAAGHTRAQLRAWLARQVTAIDPQAAARRRKKALRTRRVWITPQSDGMATIRTDAGSLSPEPQDPGDHPVAVAPHLCHKMVVDERA